MYDEDPSDDDPNFDSYFVRKYCHHQLPTFVVYFPIILLSIAAVLVVIDRPFVSHLFKSGNIDEVTLALLTCYKKQKMSFNDFRSTKFWCEGMK